MTEGELRQLAKFMGHSLNIHADHYEMKSNLLQRTKIARVLAAIDNGKLHKLSEQQSLDTVTVADADICGVDEEVCQEDADDRPEPFGESASHVEVTKKQGRFTIAYY